MAGDLGTALSGTMADDGVDEDAPDGVELVDDGPGVSTRRTLYATLPTRRLALQRGHVVATGKSGDVRLSVPIVAVERLVVVGPVGVSAGLRSHVLRHGIDVVFLSHGGRWLGRYATGRPLKADLRRAQYALEDDPARRLRIASQLVAAKAAAQRAMLRRYRHRDGELASCIADLGHLADRIPHTEDRTQLMGIEGAAAARYFDGIRRLLPEGLGFQRRARRPPTDVFNAALSFGYALLIGEAHAAVSIRGLDAWSGILHESTDRVAALALDIMEEFRIVVVDAAVVALSRRGNLTADHQRSADGGVLLDAEGRRRVIAAYEQRMLARHLDPHSGMQMTWRRALMLQTGRLAAIVRGDDDTYPSVGWR